MRPFEFEFSRERLFMITAKRRLEFLCFLRGQNYNTPFKCVVEPYTYTHTGTGMHIKRPPIPLLIHMHLVHELHNVNMCHMYAHRAAISLVCLSVCPPRYPDLSVSPRCLFSPVVHNNRRADTVHKVLICQVIDQSEPR